MVKVTNERKITRLLYNTIGITTLLPKEIMLINASPQIEYKEENNQVNLEWSNLSKSINPANEYLLIMIKLQDSKIQLIYKVLEDNSLVCKLNETVSVAISSNEFYKLFNKITEKNSNTKFKINNEEQITI
jgi:predicted methyltransferase